MKSIIIDVISANELFHNLISWWYQNLHINSLLRSLIGKPPSDLQIHTNIYLRSNQNNNLNKFIIRITDDVMMSLRNEITFKIKSTQKLILLLRVVHFDRHTIQKDQFSPGASLYQYFSIWKELPIVTISYVCWICLIEAA